MAQRILIDARYVDGSPSGIGRYTEHVASRLAAAAEFDVTAVVRREGAGERLGAQGEVVWDVEPNGPRTRFTMRRHIDGGSYDAFWSPFNILPEGMNTPSVFTLHDVMWLKDPSFCTQSLWRRVVTGTFYKTAIPRSVALSEAVFTVSETSRRDIEELFPSMKGRVHVTYNAVDPSFAPMSHDEGWDVLRPLVEPGTPFVLCVGQGSPYKNHGRALAGFWRAFADESDVKFVLIRRFERGPDPILEEWLGRPEVAARVIRLEQVDEEVLRALLAKAFAFAFPSLYEGFGLPSLEAMASGTPVVTSNFGAMGEVSGGAGIEVDPHDIDAIAGGLRQLFDDPSFAAAVRERGLQRAGEFNWDSTTRVVADVLAGLG